MFRIAAFSVVACAAAVALTACVQNSGNAPAPTVPSASSSAGQTSSLPSLTPQQAWDDLNQAAVDSCNEAYNGLIEEDVAGPDVGKLKIRLTFDQAGENSFAYSMPNGDIGLLLYHEFYACEIQWLWITSDNVTMGPAGFPAYSTNLPLQVSFNPQDSTFTTVQQMPGGSQRSLTYTITNGLFSRVHNLDDGSETTLTFGPPAQNMIDVVSDAYAAFNSQ